MCPTLATGNAGNDDLSRIAGIEVRNLSFAYQRRTIFENLSFTIPSTEVWGLVGRSGIGKTTLLNVIVGLYQPKHGVVETAKGQVQFPGQIRGVVFRDSSLLWWLNVIENVLFPRHKVADRQLIQRARHLLESAGLANAADLHPKQLSTGMSRRVEILRALLMDERYFVADEPFTGLDIHTRFELYAIWRKLRTEHRRCGIMCTHDPLEAAFLCDAILVMKGPPNGPSHVEVVRVPARFSEAESIASASFTDPFLTELISKIE